MKCDNMLFTLTYHGFTFNDADVKRTIVRIAPSVITPSVAENENRCVSHGQQTDELIRGVAIMRQMGTSLEGANA